MDSYHEGDVVYSAEFGRGEIRAIPHKDHHHRFIMSILFDDGYYHRYDLRTGKKIVGLDERGLPISRGVPLKFVQWN